MSQWKKSLIKIRFQYNCEKNSAGAWRSQQVFCAICLMFFLFLKGCFKCHVFSLEYHQISARARIFSIMKMRILFTIPCKQSLKCPFSGRAIKNVFNSAFVLALFD